MADISERIRLLRELEAKATKGPWFARAAEDYGYGTHSWIEPMAARPHHNAYASEQTIHNDQFTAEMRNSLLPLLDHLEAMQRERDGLREVSRLLIACETERRDRTRAGGGDPDNGNGAEPDTQLYFAAVEAALKGSSTPTCQRCGGSGEIHWTEYSPAGHPMSIVDDCPLCRPRR